MVRRCVIWLPVELKYEPLLARIVDCTFNHQKPVKVYLLLEEQRQMHEWKRYMFEAVCPPGTRWPVIGYLSNLFPLDHRFWLMTCHSHAMCMSVRVQPPTGPGDGGREPWNVFPLIIIISSNISSSSSDYYHIIYCTFVTISALQR